MKSITTLLLLLPAISFVTAQSSIGLHFGGGGYHSLGRNNGVFKPEKNLSLSMGLDYHVKFKKGFSFYTSIGVLRISDEVMVADSFSVRGGATSSSFLEFNIYRSAIFFPTQVGVKYSKVYNKIRFFVQPYIETDVLFFSKGKVLFYQDNGQIVETVNSSYIFESKSLFYTVAFGFGLGIEKDLGKKINIYLMPDIKLLFTDIYLSTERGAIISAIKLGILYKL